jgi:L-threonylcarbamoyladenylate synthase
VKEEIEKALEAIKNGGVILYPTDTIWGLGCDPKDEEALAKINTIKNRPDNKNFIVLVDSERLLSRYVKVMPEVCYDLIDFADKPLTIIYPGGRYVSDSVLAEDKSIGIRVVKDEFCQKLIQKFKSGIISTSANISGEPNPTNFKEISEKIKEQVDYIVDLPIQKTTSRASQIIKISEKSEVTIIRK